VGSYGSREVKEPASRGVEKSNSTLPLFGSAALRLLELTPEIIMAQAEKVEKPERLVRAPLLGAPPRAYESV
jgi:hypothetical protein